jgi:4-amino-4-deoxy-L-arabinose transferase-like glycosyltransferase
MTIDAPLLFFWCFALYAFWRCIESGQCDLRWMAGSTAAVGLGLLSKQTMLVFFPLAGIFLLTGRDDRRHLARWPFWLWTAGSLLFLLPVIFWNSRHGWITLFHTMGHFETDVVGLKQRIIRFGEFFGSQFGILSPVTFGLILIMAGLAQKAQVAWIDALKMQLIFLILCRTFLLRQGRIRASLHHPSRFSHPEAGRERFRCWRPQERCGMEYQARHG